MIYKWIGMLVVAYVKRIISKRVSTETIVKVGVGTAVGITAVTGIAIATYVVTRDVPEG